MMKMNELEAVLLNAGKPSVFFERLREDGELDAELPELKALIGVPQNKKYHVEGDVWTHTMMVTDEAAERRDIVKNPLGFMLSALCHDMGKAVSTTVDEDGTVHAYEHEKLGIPIVRTFLGRFTNDEKLTGYVLNMTELHMEPNKMAAVGSKLKKTNRLFDSSAEPFDLIQLAVCDGLGKLPKCDDTEGFLMERFRIFEEMMKQPYVTAQDLVNAGAEPSADINEVLAYAHKLRLAGLGKDEQLRQSLAYARTIKR